MAKNTSTPVKVRLLMDCMFGKVNQVVELAPDDLADAQARGEVDPNPEAVAYAEAQLVPALAA